MSFRLKIVVMTTALVALLFGIGGTVLIHTSFQASLEKEEGQAVDDNKLILKIVQYVGEEGGWFREEQLISVIENVSSKDTIGGLQLICEGQMVYSYQNSENLLTAMNTVENLEENQVKISYFTSEKGNTYLQTSMRFQMNEQIYYLHMERGLKDIYQVRNEQLEVFRSTFLVLFVLGMLASWILATYLTRHLRKLIKASKEIGNGNLSYRSKVHSEDEIGVLSQEFDKMAENLEENINLLKETAEQKEQFMGAFTHELKTPMTSIIGYADLMRTQKLSEKDQADALDYIFSEGKRLENLSLKMLDLFVADKQEIVLKKCNPAQITRYVAAHLKNTYDKYQIRIEVETENGSCMLESDLYQTLLINLLDNSRKAMEEGGLIRVGLRLTETGCVLQVTDTGKGIPEEAMKHLTEAFYRVDKARARSKGSAGLGLALCEKIVQLHHGSMHFESQEGIGTTVTACLNGGWNEEMEE